MQVIMSVRNMLLNILTVAAIPIYFAFSGHHILRGMLVVGMYMAEIFEIYNGLSVAVAIAWVYAILSAGTAFYITYEKMTEC